MWLYNSGPALNNDGCINAAKGKVVTLQKHTINLAGFMQLIEHICFILIIVADKILCVLDPSVHAFLFLSHVWTVTCYNQ